MFLFAGTFNKLSVQHHRAAANASHVAGSNRTAYIRELTFILPDNIGADVSGKVCTKQVRVPKVGVTAAASVYSVANHPQQGKQAALLPLH